LNERKVVRGELVIARRNPAAVLDLVEEALDQVPSAVEIRAEADRLGAVASWRDVGPYIHLLSAARLLIQSAS
jgi:hypothetical protein